MTVSGPSYAATNLANSEPCKDIEAVFARGSGQALNENEFQRFRAQLSTRIEGGRFSTYEVGTEAYDGKKYKPVEVDGWSTSVGIDAKVSSGGAFLYGQSVDYGIAELSGYLDERMSRCPSTSFILGGYSQGAQVVGETWVEALTPAQRGRVVFNALFGDPKLYLPEGEGLNPPACQGEDEAKKSYSEWRRGKFNCQTDNGSLNARIPYLPASWTSNTGSWCNDSDFVCGSSKWPFSNSGHMTYFEIDGGIDKAAAEAVSRLPKTLDGGPGSGSDLITETRPIGSGTGGEDVVFVIDSTGSMTENISEATSYASTMGSTITALHGRVALVEYRDAGDEFVAEIRSPLSSDLAPFQAALGKITATGGGDNPEALLTAMMTALNGLDWRDGATKSAVTLTDASYHDPDVANGWTLADVTARALEIDPVNVYPVVPSWLVDTYTPLAEGTSGVVIDNSGDTVAALTEALALISARPIALLPLAGYSGLIGDTFTFDASESYGVDSDIVDYAFDFDGDGTFETSGADPVASHVYDAPFDGVMQVRVTAADGGVGSASATVLVTAEPAPTAGPAAPQDVTLEVVSTVENMSEVKLSWVAGDDTALTWGVAVNDVDVGVVDGPARSVNLTDIERSEDVTVAVRALDSTTMGPQTSAFLARLAVAAPTPSPTATAVPVPADPTGSADPSDPSTVAADSIVPIDPKADGSDLAKTGVDAGGLTALALLLLGVGAAVTVIRSQRHKASDLR